MARTKKPPTRPTADETERTPSETTDCDRLVLGTWKGDAGLEKTSHSIYALNSDEDDDASQYAALEYDASEDDASEEDATDDVVPEIDGKQLLALDDTLPATDTVTSSPSSDCVAAGWPRWER